MLIREVAGQAQVWAFSLREIGEKPAYLGGVRLFTSHSYGRAAIMGVPLQPTSPAKRIKTETGAAATCSIGDGASGPS